MSEEIPKFLPWFDYKTEEKSYVVFQAYRNNILNSEEVKPFLNKARLSNVSYWSFPVVFYLLCDKTLFKFWKKGFGMRMAGANFNGLRIATVGFSWLLWANWNPVYLSFLKNRQELLETMHKRVGFNIRFLNTMLPRYWTENEIHRRMRQLYNERNSVFTGFYSQEEKRMTPLIDYQQFAKYKNPEKVIR